MMFLVALFFAFPSHAVTLDQAMESTVLKNESVGQSRAQLNQARETVKQYKGAIFPTISLNGSYLMQPAPSDPTAAAFFPERQTTASARIKQPLFRGLREFAAVRREKHIYSAQEHTYLSQMISLYQKVAESYMNVLALEQDVRNIEAQKRIYQGRVKDLQARTRRGESSSTEALTAQSTAAALDAEYQIQNSQLRAARENFSFLTGLPLNVTLEESEDLANISTIKPVGEYLARIDDRTDVKILKERHEAADEDVSIARGAHWPTADVTGNYYFVRPDGFTKDLKWDVMFEVSIPLFEGGITQSQVRQAASRRGETSLALAETRRRAEAEIRSLHDSLRMRADQLKYLKLSSDLAEKNYQVLLRDSRRGLTRSIDVQLGLTEYRIAKRTYDQARYQARLERIRLDLASATIPALLTKDMQ